MPGSKATAACEACRRRKTRCDGTRPQCGACYSAHTTCILVDERPRRGPKKGELRALKAQVGKPPLAPESLPELDISSGLSDMLHRDALYYLRVHPLLPMVHQWHYLSWAQHQNPGTARSTLRLAMWTLASAFSAQYRALGTSLYHLAQNMAHANGTDTELPWETTATFNLEHTQAWLLLAHYELRCVDHNAALQTAARVYRLVQASGLYNLDVTESGTSDEEALILKEDKRRTFWLAFCLDRLVTSQDSLHMTLQEEMLHVNLPSSPAAPEPKLNTRGQSLRDAVSQSTPDGLSPLSEMIVLATLYGRCVTHRRLAATDASNAKSSPGGDASFWKRHEWLAARIQQRTPSLPTALSELEITLERGPLAMLSHFLVRGAAIHLSDTLWCLGFSGETAARGPAILECRRRALHAATEMAGLARTVRSLGSFRVHPYLPSLLAHAAAFLGRNRDELEQPLSAPHAERDLLESLQQLQDSDPSPRQFVRTLEGSTGFGY
ncbi:hypothetical protein Micbo1qcDRAFT_182901 [Microdochium bolleyi]|uniref:Zn(2)-C6 fungal-type domain-containing protein n=1 Tax=Microdochium bolleyi TaxID=196109 RepID=A0A136J5Q9_9PEZI|nr:hypothetical protein Micbo1qcDRAFT_182901 [Microdochium bolleyi]